MNDIIAPFHQENISLDLSKNIVRQYIKTPQRIQDYYPLATCSGEIPPYFFCRSKTTVSLFEILIDNDSLVKFRVWNALQFTSSVNAEDVKSNAFFIMDEHWELKEEKQKTIIVKTWSNMQQSKWKKLPISWIVKTTAKKESRVLVKKWEQFYAINQ